MDASDLALVRGMRDTRATLHRWNASPGATLLPWFIGALAIALALLGVVCVIAKLSIPDPSGVLFPGLTGRADAAAVGHVLLRNSLVLALHAMACVAGFIAGSSLPTEAERYSGWVRRLHDRAGPLAMAFVACATMFSLGTQAYALGGAASTLSAQLDIAPGILIIGLLPHAIPELVGLFLPLAAWIFASRRGDWHELLAATFVTVAIATPMVIAAGFVEVYVSPHVILALR
jgi:hypothetical protein